MKILKFLVACVAIFGITVFSYGYLKEYDVIDTIVNYYKKTPSTLENNLYYKDYSDIYMKTTDDFEANNKDELLKIYYTIVASGMDEFTFYCSNDYYDCTSDIVEINNDNSLLSKMNNFVNVFNTFKSVKTTYTNTGKITLSINKRYSNEDIEYVNSKIDEIYNKIIDNNKDIVDNIKSVHDYIINNTKYNVEEEDATVFTESTTAIGVLKNNLATCNGYTDVMSIFLDRLGVKNARITTNSHIWNVAYLNGEWLHIDVTGDDPVNDLNLDKLTYDYFLKTYSELKLADIKNKSLDYHDYDEVVYSFAN